MLSPIILEDSYTCTAQMLNTWSNSRIWSNLISNDLDLDLETHNKSHYLIYQVKFSWKSYSVYIGLHMIIIKLHQVLIENVPQLDINSQLDLESQIRNQK